MFNMRSPQIALAAGLAMVQRAGMTAAAQIHSFGDALPRRSPTVGIGWASISRGQSYNGNHARHGGTHGSRRIRAARGSA